jgi:hypothetical protein
MSILPTTPPVYVPREWFAPKGGCRGGFRIRPVYEAIRRGSQASTSRRLEKWRMGTVSGSVRPT